MKTVSIDDKSHEDAKIKAIRVKLTLSKYLASLIKEDKKK